MQQRLITIAKHQRRGSSLAAGGNEVLQTSGSVTAEEAKEHAETEFEKYRIVQDRLFQSDFDKYLGELPFDGE